MADLFYEEDSNHPAHFYCLLVLLIYLVGFGLGSLFFHLHSSLFSPMMYTSVNQAQSIVGVFVNVFFPLAFCFLAIFSNAPAVLVVVFFLKSISFGFTSTGITAVYGNAGWLVRLLFLFTDRFIVAVLLWCTMCYFAGAKSRIASDAVVCVLILCMVTLIDKFVISVVLQSIITA